MPVRERGYVHPELLAEPIDLPVACLIRLFALSLLVLTGTTLVAKFSVPFALMAIPSAGCEQGPRCQSPRSALTWSGRWESTSTQSSSSTTRVAHRRRGWSCGRSSTTVIPMAVYWMVA